MLARQFAGALGKSSKEWRFSYWFLLLFFPLFSLQTNLIYSCNFFMPNLRASAGAATEAELSLVCRG